MTDDTAPAVDTVEAIDAREALNIKALSPFQMARRRYFHHKGAAASTVIMAILLIVVVFAPMTARYGVNQQVLDISEGKNQYLSPRSIAWMGTDQIGRDLFSRLIWGVRTSLFIGVASAILSVIIGTAVGAVAGLKGGWFDDVMMRVTDLFLAFPFIVIIIIMRAFLGAVPWITGIIGDVSSIRFIIALFAIFGWMGVARLVRGCRRGRRAVGRPGDKRSRGHLRA